MQLLAIYERSVLEYRAGVDRLKDLHGAEFDQANKTLDDLQKRSEEARKALDRHRCEHNCGHHPAEPNRATTMAA